MRLVAAAARACAAPPMTRWLVVVAACGGAAPATIGNRADHVRCDVPHVLVLAARRYANLDRGDPAYDRWTPWTLELTLDADRPVMRNAHGHVRHVRGTARLAGDGLHLDFPASGAVSCELRHALVRLEDHEPFELDLDFATRTGIVRSIDDRWLIGPPFPAHPP